MSSWFADSYSYKEGKLYHPKTKEDLQKYVDILKKDNKFNKIVNNYKFQAKVLAYEQLHEIASQKVMQFDLESDFYYRTL